MSSEHTPHEHRDFARTESKGIEASSGRTLPDHNAVKPGLAADLQPATADMSRPSPTVAASSPAAPLSAHAVGALPAAPVGSGVKSLALMLDTDLFFSVKVTDTLKHIGYATRTFRRSEDFAAALVSENPALALVNTGARGVDWRGSIAAAVAAGVPVVAFGAHVDLTTQQEARELGARVIANSKLASDLPGVVARALARNHQRQE